MKKNRTIAVIFYLCSVAFYILAIIAFIGETTTSMGVTWLCLGSMWLCLGTLFLRKAQNDDDHSDSENGSESKDDSDGNNK